MSQRKLILAFLGRFVLVFGLLAIPWPGWPEAYAGFVRRSAKTLYRHFGAKGVVLFQPSLSGDRTLDTEILLGNRAKLDASQRGDAARLPFNTRFVAYFPSALALALVLATGVSWRRRVWASLWALVFMHLFIACLIGLMLVSMVNAHPELELFELAPFWRRVVTSLYDIFLTYLGARFAVAVLVWILVTFRRGDYGRLLGTDGNAGPI